MATLSLSDILDDLQVAEQGLHRFERRYWISSEHFYELYSSGQLDTGENMEEFAEWSGHYKLRQKRQAVLQQISAIRMKTLQQKARTPIRLMPAEPVYAI